MSERQIAHYTEQMKRLKGKLATIQDREQHLPEGQKTDLSLVREGIKNCRSTLRALKAQ